MNRRWLVLFLAFTFCLFTYSAEAAFFDRNNCDEIPSDQRVAEGTMCLQRTTAGGRPPATYVWNGTIWRQDSNIPRVTIATQPASPKAGDVIVVTDAASSATCTTGGGVASSLCQWDGSTWVTIGGGGAGGGGHAVHDEGGASLTQRSDINCVGAGVTCADVGGMTEFNVPGAHTIQDEGISVPQRQIINVTGAGATVTDAGGITVLNVPGGAGTTFTTVGTGVNMSSVMTCGTGCQVLTSGTGTITPNYTPSGTIAATTVQGAIAELDSETQTALAGKQPLDTDLTALAGNTNAGFWAAATNVARTFQNGTGIAWTNPAGVAGNPQANVTANVVMTDRANTYTTGVQDLSAASLFVFPTAAGLTPTTPGACAFDTKVEAYKCGLTNGSTIILAPFSSVQPINANLTAFSALTGVANTVPRFTGVGAMILMTIADCPNTGGNTLNTSGTNLICGNQGGSGFTNGVNGTVPKYASASTMAPSIITESAGVVNIAGGFVVGTCPPCLTWDTSAIATTDKMWTIQNVAGTILPAAAVGTFTNNHVLKAIVAGGLVTIADGGIPGVGDVTAAGPNTMNNTTINTEGAGNVITIVSYSSIAVAGCSNVTPGEAWDLPTSGAAGVICSGTTTTLGSLAFIDGSTQAATTHFRLHPNWVGNVDIDLVWWANSSTANAVRWSVSTGCVGDGQSINTGPSYNTASASNTAYTGTANQRKTTSFTAVNMANCSVGETAFLRVERIGADAGDTLVADANLVEVGIKLRHT